MSKLAYFKTIKMIIKQVINKYNLSLSELQKKSFFLELLHIIIDKDKQYFYIADL